MFKRTGRDAVVAQLHPDMHVVVANVLKRLSAGDVAVIPATRAKRPEAIVMLVEKMAREAQMDVAARRTDEAVYVSLNHNTMATHLRTGLDEPV